MAATTSPALLHAAADLVEHGAPVAEAARAKGVTRASLRRWLAERPAPGGAATALDAMKS